MVMTPFCSDVSAVCRVCTHVKNHTSADIVSFRLSVWLSLALCVCVYTRYTRGSASVINECGVPTLLHFMSNTKPTACATAQRSGEHSHVTLSLAVTVTVTLHPSSQTPFARRALRCTSGDARGASNWDLRLWPSFPFLKNWSHLHQALSNCQHASAHRVNQEQKRRFASQTPHPMPRANALTPSFRSAHRSRVYGELLRPKLRCVARAPSRSASQLCRRHSCPFSSKFILMRHSFSTRQAFTLILTIAGIGTCTTK